MIRHFVIVLFLVAQAAGLAITPSIADALMPSFEHATELQGPPIVTTPCGPIVGALDDKGDKGSIARFAVPFALPPVGDLRWRPPVPAQCPWSGTYNGSFVPNTCVDTRGSGSEDCLYLNILVPVKNNQFPPANPLPVVVYFHGGDLIGGSAVREINGSESLALAAPHNGLLLLTVPYRLNLMGWLATADLAEEQGGHSGNYGLQDAILALKWIQNNIASFGGDPKRVTLLGESSGGTMIFGLFASPAAAGLFAGGISLSGSPNMTENAVGKWAQDQVIVESNSECSQPGTAAERLACLRQLDAASVAQATPSEWTTPDIFGWLASPSGTLNPPAAGGIGYTAAIYVDGLTIPLPFDQALAAGINSQASLVISNMVAEPDGIQPIASALHSAPNDLWPRLLQRAFASWPNIESAVPTVMNLYQEEIDIGGVQLAYDAFVSDYGLTCANLKVGATAVSSGLRNAPTYLLYNAWPSSSHSEDGTGQWPYHGQDWAEIQALWSDFPPQTSDLIVSALLMTLVTDFAYNSGVMPDNWNWSPLQKDLPPQTFVVAQDTVYPSGGVRAETNWRADRCAVLEALGLDQQYWWVN